MILFNQQHRFTEQEIALGEQAAAQIALALNRADLLETVSRRVVQLGLMQDIGRQMAESLDEKEICQRTVDAMAKAFGYDEAAISMLVDHDELELAAINGAKDMQLMHGFRQKVGVGIIGHVAQTCRQYFTSNVNDDPYFFHPSLQTAGAAMGMPMLHEGNLLGVIYIQSTPPHAISPDDAQILQTLASSLVTAIQKARLYAATRDHLNTLTAIQFVSDTVASSLDLKNVLNLIASLLKEKFEYEYTSIYLLKDEVLQIGAQAGYPDHLVICEIPITSGVTGRTIRTRQVQFVRNVNEDESFLRVTHEVTDEICVPLLKEGIPLGVLNVESNSERPLTEKDVELLTALAGPIALAIDNASLHAEVTSLALTDGMTGLMNRRAFDQTLETEIARATRYNQILSLIMLDMDSFKHYNDSYGHPAGDERIKGFAAILLDNARTPDVAARYGGEEFAIILPHTGKTGAILLAERIREAAAAQSPNPIAPGTPSSGYTASLGVASFPEDGTTPADLLLAADNAEMTAKRLGRNRVCAVGLAEIPQS
jgi:diguanylate cyclase (GGDEF)-like protein